MSNTEVKLLSADSSWWETTCEDRTLPRKYKKVGPKGLTFFVTISFFQERVVINLQLLANEILSVTQDVYVAYKEPY